MNIPEEPQVIDLKFKYDYMKLQKAWFEKNKWYIFKPLADNDEYNYSNIRIPSGGSQEEFDILILNLVKLIIDSLNEEKLIVVNDKDEKGEKLRGIRKLEQWFIENNVDGYDLHIKFLRELQGLRSSGTGHRKGDNYKKIAKKFDLNIASFQDVFEKILYKADELLLFLKKININI